MINRSEYFEKIEKKFQFAKLLENFERFLAILQKS